MKVKISLPNNQLSELSIEDYIEDYLIPRWRLSPSKAETPTYRWKSQMSKYFVKLIAILVENGSMSMDQVHELFESKGEMLINDEE